MLEVSVFVVAAIALGGIVVLLQMRGRRSRARRDCAQFVAAHGLTVVDDAVFDFHAKGPIDGRGLLLFWNTVTEPNDSSATEKVTLRLRGPRRYGRVMLAHPDRIDPDMKQAAAPLGHGRVVAIARDATDPDWLSPDVVSAIAALPPTAHVETYDDQIHAEFRDHKGPPPLEDALTVMRRIADGPNYRS